MVANELEKAHRFGRHFSLLEVELVGLAAMRERSASATAALGSTPTSPSGCAALRGTDLCAVDGESRFALLLAETDALGAAVLKRRMREPRRALRRSRRHGDAAAAASARRGQLPRRRHAASRS